MFVAENGNGTPARCENTADLLEHIPAWIHVLPDLIVWIISVLTNEQDTINGKFISTKRQCLSNALIDRNTVRFGEPLPNVPWVDLIQVN